MEKICINEYIRTVEGEILKVTDTDVGETPKGDVLLIELDKKEYTEIGSWIKKHSKNIIDLIEAGDVINYYSNYSGNEIKMEVDYVCCKKDDYKWGLGYVSTHYDDYVYIEDIKSIVTKQQYKNIEYKVED